MTGILTLSRFSGRFGSLNGTLTLTATRADFIRSLLTVGYPSRRAAIRTVGRWREEMLVAMATGYLDHNLHTTTYFRNLEQTEKAAVSFLFGEAFTHWCAQDRMNIEYLVHVAGLRSCTWGAATTPVTPKPGALPPAPKSRPDFIGIRRTERHVFESKGRIRRPSTATVNKALGQVSALHSINGRPPTTRCASFFMMKASGPEGKVVDRRRAVKASVSVSTNMRRSPEPMRSSSMGTGRGLVPTSAPVTSDGKSTTVSFSVSTRKSCHLSAKDPQTHLRAGGG